MSSLFFFFQAEDGIRDAQESRGLGDVYKRQTVAGLRQTDGVLPTDHVDVRRHQEHSPHIDTPGSVSYTHLTLPTIYSV